MNVGPHCHAVFLGASILAQGCCARSFADDSETPHQLTLADLAAYRAALSGKTTAADARASDPPARVNFKDLWNRPDALRGRRVTIQGRVERIFRQGPVGSFPALAEIWIVSPAGDPFCLVVPQQHATGDSPVNSHDLEGRAASQRMPELGRTIRFTGTFLKMVRYAAGDGARLAPLVVGDQPPVLAREATAPDFAGSSAQDHGISGGGQRADSSKQWSWSPVNWLLGLTLTALSAGVLAWQHLRAPSRGARRRDLGQTTTTPLVVDPPLTFIEPRDEP